MHPIKYFILFIIIVFTFSFPLFAEEPAPPPINTNEQVAPSTESSPQAKPSEVLNAAEAAANAGIGTEDLTGDESLDLDFENPDVYIDTSEAIRSKQYVRRAILSSVIETTSKFSFSRMYLNHLMGFNSIYHKTRFAKYTSGMQGISVGYVTERGHGFEGGFEVSSISNIFAGYRKIFTPERFSLWPFVGVGGGMDVGLFNFSDPPPEAQNYNGMKAFGFVAAGIMIPLVDVGIKIEFRGNFYGLDRLVLTQGIGAVIFL